MSAYYNEYDKKKAEWLRELIKRGLIADGIVDDRPIQDVSPEDIKGFDQCHFFAGIGVWSYALKQAGWPDDRRVWTGSCPCQPFSNAGKRKGIEDDRHLWPNWFWLIAECSPITVFGEQVASKDGLAWFDIVSSDLEAADYTTRAADICAAGFGAPHIRQRLYFVADVAGSRRKSELYLGPSKLLGEMGITEKCREKSSYRSTAIGELADAEMQRYEESWIPRTRRSGFEDDSNSSGSSATNGFWRDSDWLFCRDNKWRSVEPGTFPLAYGAPARVGRLRGYGDAIVAPVAEAFIRAKLEDEEYNGLFRE